jgi:hypothetical protein
VFELIKTLVWLIVLAWVVAANFNIFEASDTVTIYRAYTHSVKRHASYPKQLTRSPFRFRAVGNTITRELSQSIDRYDDCAVLDIENWKCTYSDNSGSFGIRDGDYWEKPIRASADLVISEFEYHLLKCKWQLVDGVQYLPMCLIEPFFGD